MMKFLAAFTLVSAAAFAPGTFPESPAVQSPAHSASAPANMRDIMNGQRIYDWRDCHDAHGVSAPARK